MKTFVTEYYLQDAGGQSPYTRQRSHCGGFDNYGLLGTIKPWVEGLRRGHTHQEQARVCWS